MYVSVYLEIVLILIEDRCTVCAERAIGSKIVLDTGWNSWVTWLIWNLVLERLEMLLVWCKIVVRFALNVPQAQKSFWTQLEARLERFGRGSSRSSFRSV
jgi:hypothetical protein